MRDNTLKYENWNLKNWELIVWNMGDKTLKYKN